MFETPYKHYIKTQTINSIRFVTSGLCDAFEQPTAEDILLGESESRQFNIDLHDGMFNPKYKWTTKLVELSQAEKQIWLDSLPKPEPTTEEKLSALQIAMDELILGGM